MTEEQIIVEVKQRPDSIELGPSGARVKLYVDFEEPELVETKVKNANKIEKELAALNAKLKTIKEGDER